MWLITQYNSMLKLETFLAWTTSFYVHKNYHIAEAAIEKFFFELASDHILLKLHVEELEFSKIAGLPFVTLL